MTYGGAERRSADSLYRRWWGPGSHRPHVDGALVQGPAPCCMAVTPDGRTTHFIRSTRVLGHAHGCARTGAK